MNGHLPVQSFWFVVALCVVTVISYIQAQDEQAPLWAYGFAAPPQAGRQSRAPGAAR